MTQKQWDAMMAAVASQVPEPKTVAPENDLHPDPARLAADYRDLERRVREIESYIGRLNLLIVRPVVKS